MTDRTTIAAMALQGLLANPNHGEISYDDLADMAVSHADALISALGGTVTPTSAVVAPVGDTSPDLRSLGVSGRAAAPLERMGVSTLAQLAVQTRADIAEVKGVSTDTMKVLDRLLADNGLSWDWKPGAASKPEPEPETVSEPEDDDLEDVL